MADTAPPPGIDITRPNIARVYDYMLGGKDNFAVDREQGDRMLALEPRLRDLARGNREFLCAAAARAAREGGIGQFLDLGAGLPASPAIHDAARAVLPEARFAYIDSDPVACLHTRALLAGTSGLSAGQADMTDPAAVLAYPEVAGLLDLDEPLGIIFGSVAHFLPPDQMRQVVAGYLSRAAPGSWLIISIGRTEDVSSIAELKPSYRAAELYVYSRDDLASLFGETFLLPPGLQEVRAWITRRRAPLPPTGLFVHCGVGVTRP